MLAFHTKATGTAVVDPFTGEITWKTDVKFRHRPTGNPLVVGDMIISIDSYTLRAFRPNHHKGEIAYEYRVPGAMQSTPLLHDGRLYLFTRNGSVH